MTSTNFTISWDSVNSGGDDISSSTNFRLHDTIGEQGSGTSSSATYQLRAGYRLGDREAPILSFDVGTQENATETSYSAFSNAANTVTVSATSSFSVNDFIGIVENKGAAQIIAVGKITSIAGAVITVDDWDGNPAGLSAAPAGADDFVYRLQGDAAALGTLTVTSVATSLTHTNVTTNSESGYTVYVSSDGALRVTPTVTISSVADGTVTAGTEEYGFRVFGTNATSTGSDFAITTSTIAIQTATSSATESRVGFIYKASIAANTDGGSYTQQVYYTVTGNY